MIQKDVIQSEDAYGRPILVLINETEERLSITVRESSSDQYKSELPSVFNYNTRNGISSDTTANGTSTLLKLNGASHKCKEIYPLESSHPTENSAIMHRNMDDSEVDAHTFVDNGLSSDTSIVKASILLFVVTIATFLTSLLIDPLTARGLIHKLLPPSILLISILYLHYKISYKVIEESLTLVQGQILYLKKYRFMGQEKHLLPLKDLAISETLTSTRILYSLTVKRKNERVVLFQSISPKLACLENIFSKIKAFSHG